MMKKLRWCPDLGCYIEAYPGGEYIPGPALQALMDTLDRDGSVTIVMEFTQD